MKFFRRIRQSLLSDNKIGKYLAYALGEILLVVIGILIAIQLNTWKTESDERVKVLKHLDGLNSELIQDHKRMDSLYAFYSGKTDAIQLLLQYSDQDSQLSNEELGKIFNSIFEYKKFSNKRSTYISLINGGYISKIEDKELINEIIKYYESPFLAWSTEIYGNIFESIDYSQTETYNSKDALILFNRNNSIPNWKMTNRQYQTNYEELVHSKWVIDILTRFLIQSNFIYSNLDNYREINDHLRGEIENYRTKADTR